MSLNKKTDFKQWHSSVFCTAQPSFLYLSKHQTKKRKANISYLRVVHTHVAIHFLPGLHSKQRIIASMTYSRFPTEHNELKPNYGKH